MRTVSTCNQCGKVFEKQYSEDAGGDHDEIAMSMVSYLARRHREKTGHTTSPIQRLSDTAPQKVDIAYRVIKKMDYGSRQERAEIFVKLLRTAKMTKSYPVGGRDFTTAELAIEIENMTDVGKSIVGAGGLVLAAMGIGDRVGS